MSETKEEVFNELLEEYSRAEKSLATMTRVTDSKVEEWIANWRKRYDRAEVFESAYHDVDDLYEKDECVCKNCGNKFCLCP